MEDDVGDQPFTSAFDRFALELKKMEVSGVLSTSTLICKKTDGTYRC